MIDVQTLKDADTEIGKIQHGQVQLVSQLHTLEKRRETLLVDAGEGFFCIQCKKYVEKTNNDKSSRLCYDCLRKNKRKAFKHDTLAKLHGARVKDITVDGFVIKSIIINRDGKSTLLSAYGDYDGDYCDVGIEIGNKWADGWSGKELRPGEKTRSEKPLHLEK